METPLRSRLLRDLLPTATLFYIGGAFIGAPYFFRGFYPAEILATVGTLLVIAAIVTFWGTRLDRRIASIADLQAKTSEFGVTEVGVADRHSLWPVLRRLDPHERMFIINRDDARLLFDVMRFAY